MIWLRKLKIDGFVQILVAKELAKNMDAVAMFPAKHQRKRQYNESAEDFTHENSKDDNRINYFNRIVDVAIPSLQPRFELLKSTTVYLDF